MVQGRAPVHVVLTKCDLVLSAELAKRYVLMERELAQLGLRRLQWPLHMASARTGGGIAELRSALDASLPGGWLRGGTPAAADAAPAHPGAPLTRFDGSRHRSVAAPAHASASALPL